MLVGIIFIIIIILYLFAIQPRIKGRVPMPAEQVIYYAHRGLHDKANGIPENSLPAFKQAVESGYGMELDVQLTKDGVAVVFHDITLIRMCGVEGKVSNFTYEELQKFPLAGTEEKIPTFAQVLQVVKGKMPLIVELKMERLDQSVCEVIAKILREYKGPYVVESFNPLVVYWYKKNFPEVCRGQLSEPFRCLGSEQPIVTFGLRHLLFNFITRPDFIAFHCGHPHALSRWLCTKLYGAIPVAWTVRSPQQLEKIRNKFQIYIFENFLP